jgi:hypothetical protein
MNLEKLNVAELNAQEVQEIEGGGWMAYVLGYVVGTLATIGQGLENADFQGQGANK